MTLRAGLSSASSASPTTPGDKGNPVEEWSTLRTSGRQNGELCSVRGLTWVRIHMLKLESMVADSVFRVSRLLPF